MKKIKHKELFTFINMNREFYYKLAYSYTPNSQEALYIIQTSICMASNSMKMLYNPLAMNSWFYNIVVEIAIQYLNDKKRFIIVKPVNEIAIPKKLEELVKQTIGYVEKRLVHRRRILIGALALFIVIVFITTSLYI